MTTVKTAVMAVLVPLVMAGALQVLRASPLAATDPGVRGGPAGAGSRIAGLSASQKAFFAASRDEFEEEEDVEEGLGPSFNLDSCVGCHSQPASGGSSPAVNPQPAAAERLGAFNWIPSFIKLEGPVREARYKFNDDGTPDGGVHSLFTIAGRDDAPAGCSAIQEDFQAQLARNNVVFRIPTPVFGAGLIEMIADRTIVANGLSSAAAKASFGISGRANRNGNDGTIARFGWKAQNKSLLLFSGEAYSVEMGISNDLFPDERDTYWGCQTVASPNTVTDTDALTGAEVPSAIEKFGFFMRFLAPPAPFVAATSAENASIAAGRQAFNSAGCALCHTPSLQTGNSTVDALANKPVRLFSDLLIHKMGPQLADQVSQGAAQGDEFRSAPLWGLGQRIFFLHDGRTADLIEAIRAHRSVGNGTFGPSEANTSVDTFDALSETSKQNLLNFLRSL
jgi:CxxC motif-containing protein (DUF1111 family)